MSAGEKYRRWRERHPDSWRKWYERQREQRRAARGRHGGCRYRCGKRGEWAVYLLHDPDVDADVPRAAIAARIDCDWSRLAGIGGALGTWLNGRVPRVARVVGGIGRRLACRLAVHEGKRLHALLEDEWIGLCGSGGIYGVAARLAAGQSV